MYKFLALLIMASPILLIVFKIAPIYVSSIIFFVGLILYIVFSNHQGD